LTRVQVCGIKSQEDAKMCEKLGVDALGFVGLEGRARSILINEIKEIIGTLGPFITKTLIGYPKNPEEIISTADFVDADLVQIYTLDSEEIFRIKEAGFGVVRAVSVDVNSGQLDFTLDELLELVLASDMILFEPSSNGNSGGMGLSYDFNKIPSEFFKICRRFALAGGLSSDNVEIALKLDPYAVDVSSGVEVEIGKKDEDMVREFVKRCK
jgi:phosphoribosylanthranilate isomerase